MPYGVHIHCVLNISHNRICGKMFGYVGYIHHRGAFGVARFRLIGQCEGLYDVKRVTDWLHVFLYMYVILISLNRSLW